jgi:hypothetical protein
MARGVGNSTADTRGTEGGRLQAMDDGVETRTPGNFVKDDCEFSGRELCTNIVNDDVVVG